MEDPSSSWDVMMVLQWLTQKSFELADKCDMKFFSGKMNLLVAITSAKRISELQSLSAKPHYIVFHKDRVSLWTNLSFLPKVAAETNFNQSIQFSFRTFLIRANTCFTFLMFTDYCFCLHKTEQYRKSDQVFVSFSPKHVDQAISKIILAKWITDCISLIYAKKGL